MVAPGVTPTVVRIVAHVVGTAPSLYKRLYVATVEFTVTVMVRRFMFTGMAVVLGSSKWKYTMLLAATVPQKGIPSKMFVIVMPAWALICKQYGTGHCG